MQFSIVQLDHTNLTYLPHHHQPFEIVGRFMPIYDGHKWRYQEILWGHHQTKTYPDESFDALDYMGHSQRAVFLAIVEDCCVGSIRISTDWLHHGYIEDFAVDAECRHQGIGKALMDQAVAWCKSHHYDVIMLETQDNNLQACRFYAKYGFELCGLDTKKYASTKYKDEICLYFYLFL